MEFKLINPASETGFIQTIEFNFEELKKELVQSLEKYQNLVYTDDTIKNAKEDRAGLNKFKEAIENRRKEIKKLCLKPYNDFEVKVKELVSLIDKPILAIDTQIKSFENKQKEAKQKEIKDLYNSLIGDLKELLPLEKIFNQKWLNSTFTLKNVQKELTETINKVNENLKIILDLKLDSDFELQIKDKYLQTLDFGAAMAEKTRLENLCKALKEKENTVIKEKLQPEIQEKKEEINQSSVVNYIKFWAKGTKEQLIALRDFMKNNNIEYGGIN